MIEIQNSNNIQTIKIFGRFVLMRLRKWSLHFFGIIDLKEKYVFNYMKIFKRLLCDYKFIKPKVLCLGMGLGMTSYLGLPLDIYYVEPSKDVIKLASKFKKFNPIFNVTAEQYLSSNTNKTFDIVFYDIFIDNVIYYDALDFTKIKRLLNEDGLLIINTIDNKKGIDRIIKFKKNVIFMHPSLSFLRHNAIIIILKEDIRLDT